MFYVTLPQNMNKNRLELCGERKFCVEKKKKQYEILCIFIDTIISGINCSLNLIHWNSYWYLIPVSLVATRIRS